MKRAYYQNSIPQLRRATQEQVLGELVASSEYDVEKKQRDAWLFQIKQLQQTLVGLEGAVFFEFVIPRMGKRIDVVLLIEGVLFVVEYKVGGDHFSQQANDQIVDYALDLKNFHETSHGIFIVPILVATAATNPERTAELKPYKDSVCQTIFSNGSDLATIISSTINKLGPYKSLDAAHLYKTLDAADWVSGRYCPTPTIVEAAKALYAGHSVKEISRSDAGDEDLHRTTEKLLGLINDARNNCKKAICFVTGVPGAGKTLIGLNTATKYLDESRRTQSVFLSGNRPLVVVLQEALARDKVESSKRLGERVTKKEAASEVRAFIQSVHHYRDECLLDDKPPIDHIALFDEAQRAWDLDKTRNWMKEKKKVADFDRSEPEFLISCIDRHKDWGVVVCLVGGGQEINTGEAGIQEWVEAIERSFPHWHVHISDRLTDEEFGSGEILQALKVRRNVFFDSNLHLSVNRRSYRSENVSNLVKQVLDVNIPQARDTITQLDDKYPIRLTRDLIKAKAWLKSMARGTERYGVVASSKAKRLTPLALEEIPNRQWAEWFLNDKEDLRSSYFLELTATEFDVQGLELDWVCLAWGGDFQFDKARQAWSYRDLRGSKWNEVRKQARRVYRKNAYRVLMTRARQGMVIYVPEGTKEDPTRLPEFYDNTFAYLDALGIEKI